MRLLQEHPGWNYHTDDPAKLYIAHSGQSPEPWTSFNSKLLHRFHSGGAHFVQVAELEFMATGFFGEGRPSGLGGSTKWTGACYKYALYRYGRQIVILRTDGGGFYCYTDNSIDAIDYWTRLIAVLPSETLWNLCHTITHAYQTGESDGRQAITDGLAAGVLKVQKRRRGGQTRLAVVAA